MGKKHRRGSAGRRRLRGNARQRHRIVRKLDLTESEKPTARSNFFPGDQTFEERLLEQFDLEFQVPFGTRVRAKMKAGPLSPVPLVVSGCLCAVVLFAVGAPLWVRIAGIVLPWVLGSITDAWRRRHYGPRH